MIMELEQLKSDWNKVSTAEKKAIELKMMLSEQRHPVLKGIRRQFAIEISGWSVFLICYYTMFDGDQKPVFINLLLVTSVMLSLLHNISGYWSSKYLMQGNDLVVSLKHYRKKMEVYALVSVCSRVLFASGLLVFFCYNISFDRTKYTILGLAITLFSVQIMLLANVWMRRLRSLKANIAEF